MATVEHVTFFGGYGDQTVAAIGAIEGDLVLAIIPLNYAGPAMPTAVEGVVSVDDELHWIVNSAFGDYSSNEFHAVLYRP